MKKKPSGRGHRGTSPRVGTIRAHQGLGPALANVYFRLIGGTKQQQEVAEDFKSMVLAMKEGLA